MLTNSPNKIKKTQYEIILFHIKILIKILSIIMNMSSSTPPPPPPPRRNMRLISLTEIYESQGIDLTQIFSIQDILEQGRL